ncbi:MAG: aminotransferase class III-fold pyridoxal phosphate-dependent enzyme [Myxococcales bacterium]|nr:aminotransferase class III-fold pyridoxal phosphate-dependent enzyme [Myxococcales bacterium]
MSSSSEAPSPAAAADLRWPTYRIQALVLERARPHERGALHLFDDDGREFLDAVAGIGSAPLGHAHPDWVAACHAQLQRLVSTSNAYRTGPQQALAAALRERYPIPDARVFFCNTGAEASEAAIKLALRATGRDTIIAFERAFHGRTLGALSLTANPSYRAPFVRCPGDELEHAFCSARVLRVPFGDLGAARACLEREGDRVAAVFLETVQGEAGVFPATREFLIGLRRECSARGALLGADEVQCGAGRTGAWSAWSAIVGDDPALAPDLLWLAKGLGGGLPIGACLARGALAEAMAPGSHGTTFGGNPLACAAALATIEIIERDALLAQAGAQMPTLREIAAIKPISAVHELRGLGAMIGIQIGAIAEQRASALTRALAEEHGVLVTVCGGHTVRLLFPYRAGRAELEQVWDALAACLRDS